MLIGISTPGHTTKYCMGTNVATKKHQEQHHQTSTRRERHAEEASMMGWWHTSRMPDLGNLGSHAQQQGVAGVYFVGRTDNFATFDNY